MTARIPKHRPPTHPGEMLLEEFIVPSGLTQTEIAARLQISYPRLNEIIHGKRGITPDTALRFERLFGMDADFWLNLQRDWDLYDALHSGETRKRLEKIEPLSLAKAVVQTYTAAARRGRDATAAGKTPPYRAAK